MMQEAEVILVDDCTAEWDEVLKAVNLFQSETGRHMEIVGSGDLGVAVLG